MTHDTATTLGQDTAQALDFGPATETRETAGAASRLGRAARIAFPMVFAYIPVGIAYGVLAKAAGISLFASTAMSALVYAGSSQLIAVSMLAIGASPVAIVLTTLLVNLRHMLFSAALAPHLRNLSKLKIAAFTGQLTDEAFALHAVRFKNADTDQFVTFAISAGLHLLWIVSSLVGHVFGGIIGDVKPYGLDYTLPVMFMALLAGQATSRAHLVVAGFSGLASLLFFCSGLPYMDRFNVLIAAFLGASLGLFLSGRLTKRSPKTTA